MEQKHNSVIKIDLHIHSKASEYKENAGIVENSDISNISVLLSKLNTHQVSLFAITDHNRFDVELYKKFKSVLSQKNNPYPNVKNILPGIEFDVTLDNTMEKCHIIAIFNAKDDTEKLNQIKISLEPDLLKNKEASYSKEIFEAILKKIGLDVILIASQRKDINNHNGKHNSVSDSLIDVEEIIKVGYIDALEFQKPKVEGILINNLRALPFTFPLLSGSDCHDWECYPYHDSNNQNKDFHHSKAKILPTFKGLLMAITSPETRFNSRDNTNKSFLAGINLGKQKVELVNGINTIIGENGSGKTTLLELINGKTTAGHIKIIIATNDIQLINTIHPNKMKYIKQGQIIENFNKGTLFVSTDQENNFKDIDHTDFIRMYSQYAIELKKNIELNIEKKQKLENLSQYSIAFDANLENNNYYINVICPNNFTDIENPHKEPLKEIEELITKISTLNKKAYYKNYNSHLNNILTELQKIKIDIENKSKIIEYEIQVKNIMHSCIQDYSRDTNRSSTSEDQEIRDYKQKRQTFIDNLIDTIKISIKEINYPNEPSIIKGVSKNIKQGFCFNKEAPYNNVSMLNNFYTKMFLKDYRTLEEVKKIDTYDKFQTAIMNCSSVGDINTKWDYNFQKFKDESIKPNEYITDADNQQIGSTLGEMSLSYYKFFTQDNDDWNILIVDQPEDNISNNNINHKLISYFQDIRNKKQIIFVTHNPLLVVNLDADNIIFVKKEKDILSITDGCLEYEDDKTKILELIAENMDGGKETIERRLKIYGKNY